MLRILTASLPPGQRIIAPDNGGTVPAIYTRVNAMRRIIAGLVLLLWLVGLVAFIYAFYPRGEQILTTRYVEQASTAPGGVAQTTSLQPVNESGFRPPTMYDWLRFVVL